MKKLFLISAIIFFATSLFAPKTFQEVDEKTFEKKARINWKLTKDKKGLGYSTLVGHKISKVALISFGVSMPPVEKHLRDYGFTAEGVKYYANKLYDESIDAMIESFDSHGIDLLTYDDFSEEQKETLNSLGGSRWMQGLVSTTRSKYYSNDYVARTTTYTYEVGQPAYDYKQYKTEIFIKKDLSMLGLLAKALGVDAILVVNHEFDIKKGAGYTEFSMNMIGLNPISLETVTQGKKGGELKFLTKLYFEGVPYISSYFEFKNPVMIAEMKKKKLINENFTGFSSFIKNATNVTLKYYEKRTE